jgi:hypothetical protein
MGIGTSMGAYYDDEFHHAAARWDDKYDDNVIAPNTLYTNRALESAELDPTTGMGIEVRNEIKTFDEKIERLPEPPRIEDRRSETPVWTVDRLFDPRSVTSIEGTLIPEGGSGYSDIPDPLFPSKMAKDLGIDDMDKLTTEEVAGLSVHKFEKLSPILDKDLDPILMTKP